MMARQILELVVFGLRAVNGPDIRRRSRKDEEVTGIETSLTANLAGWACKRQNGNVQSDGRFMLFKKNQAVKEERQPLI